MYITRSRKVRAILCLNEILFFIKKYPIKIVKTSVSNYQQLLDEVFVINGITKREVSAISQRPTLPFWPKLGLLNCIGFAEVFAAVRR